MSLALLARACASQVQHHLDHHLPSRVRDALVPSRVRDALGSAAAPRLGVAALLALAAVVAAPAELLAQGATDPFGGLTGKGTYVVDSGFNWAKIMAALGAVAVAILGFFKKWHWAWIASIAGGLMVLAVGPDVINWAPGSGGFASRLTLTRPTTGP